MEKLLFTLSFLFVIHQLMAQTGNVGIGTNSPDPAAALDITSADKGILIPRTTKSAVQAAVGSGSIPDGLLIFDTSDNSFYYRDDDVWKKLGLQTELVDADGDTKITLDEGVRDSINFSIDGEQYLKMVKSPDGTSVFQSPAPGTFRLDISNNGGNIGIGSSALSNNVIDDLVGNGMDNIALGGVALESNVSGSNNVAMGNGALFDNVSGSYNIATGREALYSNISGQFNIATGWKVLKSNTNGNYNIGIGNEALISNTAGSLNIATGLTALYSNISGFRNIATGFEALYSNISGNHNVAIGNGSLKFSLGDHNVALGYNAGGGETGSHKLYIESSGTTKDSSTSLIYGEFDNDFLRLNGEVMLRDGWVDGSTKISLNEDGQNNINFNIEGDDKFRFVNGDGFSSARIEMPSNFGNIAIGDSSLNNSGGGQDNIAIGTNAIYSNQDGIKNIAIGSHALYHNNGSGGTGNQNIAIGSFTLNSNILGSRNTAVGESALSTFGNGYDNTALGFEAGKNSIGSSNLFLGYQTGYNNNGSNNVFLGGAAGYNESGSNKLYIENTQADSSAALIYGEFDNDILRVNGTLQVNDPAGSNGYILPISRGGVGEVLRTDGLGQTAWVDPLGDLSLELSNSELIMVNNETGNTRSVDLSDINSNSFETVNGLVRNTGNHATEDFVFGSGSLPPDGSITDTLFFFDRSKGAFRAGSIYNDDSWKDANVGENSFASGLGTKASGYASTALGESTIASGYYATATGSETNASGEASTAMGLNSEASGYYSTASGFGTEASGESSTAMGENTVASGENASSSGEGTNADGKNSTAMGEFTEASGKNATSSGEGTNAEGKNTFAAGYETSATSFAEFVLGSCNTTDGSAEGETWVDTDRLLTVGNGQDLNSLSDAMIIYKNGNVRLYDSLHIGADGSEYSLPTTKGASGQELIANADGTTSWVDQPLNDLIHDADDDTKIELVENTNRDRINFTLDGAQRFSFVQATAPGFTGGGTPRIEMLDGRNNIAMGGNALDNNGLGEYNIAIGKDALGDLNGVFGDASEGPGLSNVAIGHYALSKTDQFGNVAVGNYALENTTGDKNVAIGYLAGRNETGGNKLYIENSSADSTAALIYGEFDNDKLRINGDLGVGTNATYPLHINGSDPRIKLANSTNEGATIRGSLNTWQVRLSSSLNTETKGLFMNGRTFEPYDDNSLTLGSANFKWSEVFATNATINTSDIRFKKNINDLDYGLETVMQMRPVSYQWKNEEDGRTINGFIAQEMEEIVPEVVEVSQVSPNPNKPGTESEYSELYGMRYTELIPVLTKAIQDQQAIIEDQKTIVETLLKRVEALEKGKD